MLPSAVQQALELRDLDRAGVLRRLGTGEEAVARGVEYGPRDNLDELSTEHGRVVFDGDSVAVVYVHRPDATPEAMLAAMDGDGEELPGAASPGAELHVYPADGVAFSHDGPKLQFVEAFPPTTLDGYRARLYREPPDFIA